MTKSLRIASTTLLLVAGIAWTLPTQTGRRDSEMPMAAYSAADPAEFRITVFQGTLTIAGHTRSKHHEQRLLDAVDEYFPLQDTKLQYHPLGVAPAWWDEATLGLLALLAGLESPEAYLTQDLLRIRALASDAAQSHDRLQALRRSLPSSTHLDVRLTSVDATASISAYCERQYASLRPGPVAFKESGVEMRTSAMPALDRVVALADACRDAGITIIGHTDSTGNESLNMQLSLERARVVAAHLESRGIAAERLTAVGAGSSQPVADNSSRYGRSINRRIEFQFTERSGSN